MEEQCLCQTTTKTKIPAKRRCKSQLRRLRHLLVLIAFIWISWLLIFYTHYICSAVCMSPLRGVPTNNQNGHYRLELKHILDNLDKSQIESAQFEGEEGDGRADHFRSIEEYDFTFREINSVSAFVDDQLRYQEEKMNTIPNKGSFGKAVVLHETKLNEEDHYKFVKGWIDHGYNELASDKISVNRTLPDPRSRQCRHLQYSEDLPEVSVIITFYNEAWSVLLRTVCSVIGRSPAKLLKEIILVDDFSDRLILGEPLQRYMKKFDKVKVLRTPERKGPFGARMFGYREAKGSVLVFLDSHVECTKGWLEPLVDMIVRNKTTVASPVLDWIVDSTFEYKFQGPEGTNIGGFNWNLDIIWEYIPYRKRVQRNFKDYVPVSTAVTGGIYAIDRKFFTHIGKYEEHSNITMGVENLEFSFRVWMCGGSIEVIPCSHIGHLYRGWSPWGYDEKIMTANKIIMAEIWMDDFKTYFYDKIGYDKKAAESDVAPYRKIRHRLQCKSFNWFLNNVYIEAYIPGESTAFGQIIDTLFNVCLETDGNFSLVGNPVTTSNCTLNRKKQIWVYTYDKEIRQDNACLDYYVTKNKVVSTMCHRMGGNQLWEYTQNNTIYHPSTDRCLSIGANITNLVMARCKPTEKQVWKWNRQPAKGPVRT